MKYLVVLLIFTVLPFNNLPLCQTSDSLFLPIIEASPGDTVAASLFLSSHSFLIGGFNFKLKIADTSLAKTILIEPGVDISYFSLFYSRADSNGSIVIAGIASMPPEYNAPLQMGYHEIAKLHIEISDQITAPINIPINFYTDSGGSNTITDESGQIVFSPYLLDGLLIIGDFNAINDWLGTPVVFELYDNYPNPFNLSTNIEFNIVEPGYVTLSVYDLQGRMVKKLITGDYNPGHYQIIWDGRTDNGEIVSSGIYFYALRYNNYLTSKKMSLVK